ncbi:hypothetical protein [Pseudoprimorskyibacter insulae]|uniref:Uncharacterized protein n=1 Tax=Pseudoprimorskyibacter insulae TaxID=1695997 RepID=A0A2R8B0D6_9RHOB|nr:hypothetical protein [Pseudoprimorskyibacter insulae]SPF81746.1 hypothetical protein PRI8871_03571 [Pseudoprimorskyibacter insulae]
MSPAINNRRPSGATENTVLGAGHVADTPIRDMGAKICLDGKGEYAFHTQLRDGEDTITGDQARTLFHQACGKAIDCEILFHMGWTAGLRWSRTRSGRGACSSAGMPRICSPRRARLQHRR